MNSTRKTSLKDHSLSIHAMKILGIWGLLETVRRWGIYLIAFLSFIASSLYLKYYLSGIEEQGILISSDPLNSPFSISVIIISLYLSLVSAISISRERDQGTLEVLFYGPVNFYSYILGKYIKEIFTYLIISVFFIIYFFGASSLTNLGFSYGLLKIMFSAIFLISCVVSFGLFISSFTVKIRNSIIWLIGFFILFLVLQILQRVLLKLPKETISPIFAYMVKPFSIIHNGINLINPFSYFIRGREAVTAGDKLQFLLNILYSVIYSIIFLALSIFTIKRKGVLS